MSGMPILGVEANSVGTQAVLVRDGEILRRFEEGPIDVLLDHNGFDKLANLVKESGASAAGVGVAGVQSARDANQLEAQLRAKTGVAVVVADDTEVAQLGAFNGEPGIVVIAHTGSNSFGRDAIGRAARSGGYGHVIGDEGSHYWIGAQALRRALQSFDGRSPKAPMLENAITSAYGTDIESVMTRVTEHANDPSLVARLARIVMSIDGPVMHEILDRAADDLISHVVALREKLGALPVAMYGSVFQHQRIRQRFVAATAAVDAVAPPVFGAVILASRPRAMRDMGWKAS